MVYLPPRVYRFQMYHDQKVAEGFVTDHALENIAKQRCSTIIVHTYCKCDFAIKHAVTKVTLRESYICDHQTWNKYGYSICDATSKMSQNLQLS